MRFCQSKAWLSGALACLCSTAAHAELPLVGIIAQGTAVIDLRTRYETVTDASKTLDANAGTVRARLGYDTGYWNNFQLGFDFDQIWTVGGATYNSTRNGKTAYPTVADPAMTALNRLTLTYASDFDTKFTIGRQRLLIGNQRFVGNAGWRQHEQTFDSLSAVNTSIEDLTFTYAYLYRVNRIGGPAIPVPSNTAAAATGQANYFKSDSHVMDAVYIGVDNLRLEGYAFLLDLSAPGLCHRWRRSRPRPRGFPPPPMADAPTIVFAASRRCHRQADGRIRASDQLCQQSLVYQPQLLAGRRQRHL